MLLLGGEAFVSPDESNSSSLSMEFAASHMTRPSRYGHFCITHINVQSLVTEIYDGERKRSSSGRGRNSQHHSEAEGTEKRKSTPV